jgi:hypothetical protein
MSLKLLHMNILAQGLSNDGFLGGELADVKVKQQWEEAHNNLTLTMSQKDFDKKYTDDKITELNGLVKKPYTELQKLLDATKDIMKILRENDTYVKSELKTSDGYKKIQVLLGVNKALTINEVPYIEGPWAKLISDLLGPIQVNENEIKRTQYFKAIINAAEADIMVFVEDDIMGEVISNESKYTNIFEGDSTNGTGATTAANVPADAAAVLFVFADDAAKHINEANTYETDIRKSVELPDLEAKYKLKNIDSRQAARAYKTNSNAVVAKGKILGNYHDGTSIYWKKDTITPNQISIFTISHELGTETKPEKKSGGVIGLFEFKNDDKKTNFPNGFIVVATHLSSGHAKEKDRLNEWKNVNKAIEQFKKGLNGDIPVILSMDANSDPNYGKNVNEGGHPEDKNKTDIPQNLFETINKAKFNKFYWGNVDPKTLYSVNKIRGLGSDQPNKVGDHEIQLIDWISVSGDGFIINEVKDKAHIGTQQKQGTDNFDNKNNNEVHNTKSGFTNEGKKIYDDMATDNETKLMPNANVQSDHLPILVEISPIPNWIETLTKPDDSYYLRTKLAIANALYKLGILNEEALAAEALAAEKSPATEEVQEAPAEEKKAEAPATEPGAEEAPVEGEEEEAEAE